MLAGLVAPDGIGDEDDAGFILFHSVIYNSVHIAKIQTLTILQDTNPNHIARMQILTILLECKP